MADDKGGDATDAPVAPSRPSVIDPAARSHLANAQAVLICDACSVLDLLQDPWDDNFDEHRRPIARDLLARASAGELVVMAPERVFVEIDRHAGRLLGKTEKGLQLAAKRSHSGYDILERDGVSTAPGPIRIGAYLDIVGDACRSWEAAMIRMPTSDTARLRALERIERGDAPSSADKPEVGDCLITETVLETVTALRAQSFTWPCVFLSSNVTDFQRPSKEGPHQARDPLHAEFQALARIIHHRSRATAQTPERAKVFTVIERSYDTTLHHEKTFHARCYHSGRNV